MSPPPRPPTDPGGVPITLESLAAQLWRLQQTVDNQGVVNRIARELAETCEKQLIEVRGIDGKGGLLAQLRADLEGSAQRQGGRLGDLSSDLKEQERRIDGIEKSQVDLKARWGSAIAAVMAVASVIAQILGAKGG